MCCVFIMGLLIDFPLGVGTVLSCQPSGFFLVDRVFRSLFSFPSKFLSLARCLHAGFYRLWSRAGPHGAFTGFTQRSEIVSQSVSQVGR